MKTINTTKVQLAIQDLFDQGKLFMIVDSILVNGIEEKNSHNKCAYKLGTEDDLITVWTNLRAYISSGKVAL